MSSFTRSHPDGQHPALKSLLQWFDAAGVELVLSLLAFEAMPTCTSTPSQCACLVRAVRDIADGDLLGVIPKRAVLSIRTTSIADLIQQERIGGGLGLILAIMHEASLGDSSFW